MTVQCPGCSTSYLLPERLLGERGARVRCPTCGTGFMVSAVVRGGGAARPSITETAPDKGSVITPAGDPVAVAHAVLEVFEAFMGEALARARAQGTVLSEHGPALLAVWDEYRKRAGDGASSVVFRAALRDRLGVDLTSPHER